MIINARCLINKAALTRRKLGRDAFSKHLDFHWSILSRCVSSKSSVTPDALCPHTKENQMHIDTRQFVARAWAGKHWIQQQNDRGFIEQYDAVFNIEKLTALWQQREMHSLVIRYHTLLGHSHNFVTLVESFDICWISR